jgi:tetratricopeptide (TPR) repeat protein
MTTVKRLRLLTAALGVTAATAAVVTTVLGDVRSDRNASATPVRPAAPPADELAKTRYTEVPALAYKLGSGETVFAWQVKPTLPAAAAPRPRDVLVMVDTSASQAGPHLARARSILAALAAGSGPDDRIDVWTINIDNPSATRSLTEGFRPADSEAVHAAGAKLDDAEYGSGAVDLKAGLKQAVKAFERRGGRNQVLLYLGDGESAASPTPLSEAGRVELGRLLADRQVAFFAVPLGARVDGQNLHGLAAMTGGAVVRLTDDPLTAQGRTAVAGKLREAFDVPVLVPERVTFGPAGVEVYPTRLPPLRADRPTLVVGLLKEPAQVVSARVEGRANGNKVTIDLSERLPAPDAENYFLHAMLAQWRDAPAKDAPAVLPADRTLAMAAEQFRLFRDEFAVLAVQAITSGRLDHAEKLFQAAARLDPDSPEAKAGMKVLARVRDGELKTEKVKARTAGGARLDRALADLAQDPPAPQPPPQPPVTPPPPGAAPPPPPPGTTPAERDAIAQARAAQAVLESQFRVVVDETLRRARRLLFTDPDAAYEDLKLQRDAVLANDQLSAAFRAQLARDLEAAMAEVQLQGAEIRRQLEAQRARIAQARQRLTEFDRLLTQEEQTRARIAAFKELMSLAQFELAQQEAQVMIHERVSRGLPVPSEAHAAYRIGQSAAHLREWNELVRLRQDRYLLAMMQTEKSFIPYPDEPPVHFPPAAVWRELTGDRIRRYGTYSLGENAPPVFERMRSLLEGEVDRRVNITNLTAIPSLDALLTQLQQEFADYGVRFVYRSDLFPPDFRPGEQRLQTTSNLSGLPLGAFLDTVLRDMDMSWIARPEYIEIGPNTVTASLRYQEKVTRVFDVADLIIAIPSSVNPATLFSSIQFQGAFLTIFGSSFVPNFGFVGNPFNPFGAGGFGGALGAGALGMGGMMGMGGMGMGGMGMGGMGMGGMMGGPGMGMMGMMGGPGGFGMGGGLGAGGAGFTGVQGGLGGQFGIQGNDQSMFLVQLITSVVARGEWDLQFVGGAQQPLFNPEDLAQYQTVVDQRDLNSIGFYPPARALVVRASHRYHMAPSFKLRRADAGFGAGGPGLRRDGQLAGGGNAPPANANPPAGGGAAAPAANRTGDVIGDVKALLGQTSPDPDKLWNKVFDRQVTDPKLIVAAVEAMFEMEEFTHAAESLKAALRKGRVGGGVVHEALAVVLQAAQATPAEVERAALSGIDLNPADARAFLKAARTQSELGRHEVALAYCQRAADLEPNLPAPYVNALAYAERATDVKSDVVHWASVNLLRRDWPADGIDYHTQAKDRLGRIAKQLADAGRADDAERLRAVADGEKSRDLVVELLWQGKKADLDLVVIEPSGSRCSATHKRTTGGGVLKADVLEQGEERSEVYTAASAFPGTYTLLVERVLDRPIGNRATLKVTKHQGTDRETVEVYGVDLADPQPVQVRLDEGSRTELATVPVEENPARLATTQAPVSPFGPAGIAAGAGGASDATVTAPVPAAAALPVVSPTVETRLPGIAEGLPGLRVEAQLSADRRNVVLAANPVFSGPAKDLPLPKVKVLPGGD